MTVLPGNRVFLFGGADGKVFFEDVFLLEGQQDASNKCPDPTALQWKRLLVSHTSTWSASPRSPMLANPRAEPATFLHAGGGRDYLTMHYVTSLEETAKGMQVLVVGNVVVASDAAKGGTQAEAGVNAGMAFDMQTLRVEEMRVKHTTMEAKWEARRMDAASMWKPRARHAHSSVVVGGDQLFVFGGKDATSKTFFNDIFYYDAPLNQWAKPAANITGQLPQPRAFAGLTASEDGRTLFLFGGTDGKQEFGSLFLYDVMHSRWDSLAGATTGDRPSCRINHSLTFVAPHHLVLFGGRRRAVRQNELFIYNVNTRAWRRVNQDRDNSQAVEEQKSTEKDTNQAAIVNNPPTGRTAHATVLFHSEPAGPNAVQKLLIFGGYAGSHQWLGDLHLLSIPESVLMQAPSTRSSSRSIAATQRIRPARTGERPSARVSLSAPQQQLQTQPSQPAQLRAPGASNQQSVSSTHAPQQTSKVVQPAPQPAQPSQPPPSRPQPPTHCVRSPQRRQEQPPQQRPQQMTQQPQTPPKAPVTSAPRSPPRAPTRPGAAQQPALADITNQSTSSVQPQVEPRPSTPRNPSANSATESSPSALKKFKRRRLAEDSQDSNNSNSNSSHGSTELATAKVGIQTTLLQLLQHQPRVEDTLARILSLLTREQTARQQQSLNLETLMRVHSDDQSKRLEAATRRNEALEGQLARAEAERASLHEKLMARETELYMHKHSLEAAIPPLNERIQAIETSHQKQLTVAQVIESKISAVHDFMDELRCAGEEGTALDDSPLQQAREDTAATQPTPSPPKLLYPQRVVLALEEKLRVMQLEKEALEAKLNEMTERVERAEGREAQARQFFFSWCQGEMPPTAPRSSDS